MGFPVRAWASTIVRPWRMRLPCRGSHGLTQAKARLGKERETTERIFEMETKTLESLQKSPLFAGMSSVEIEIALSGVNYQLVGYAPYDIYALAGMSCQNADIVVSGVLVCRMSSISGKLVEVSRLRAGNLIAPAFLFGKDKTLPVSVETEGEVSVLRMSLATFEKLLRDNWLLTENFIRILSNTNAFLTKRLRVLSLLTVREKVAWLLTEMAAEQGSTTITLNRSRQQIADSCGIQKFSLLRVLSAFQKEGAIRVAERQITILDRSKMR